MSLFLAVADHLTPVAITFVAVLVLVSLRLGIPYLRFVDLVSKADTPEGVAVLAKHLAKNTGGRYINVSDMWMDFTSAATALNKEYRRKHMLSVFDKN